MTPGDLAPPADPSAFLPALRRITWLTLRDGHAHWSAGTGTARRYARGFSPLLGFADPAQPDFEALVPHCDPGEPFYTDGWTGEAPAGWRVDVASTMFKMLWVGDAPASTVAGDDLPPGTRRLGPGDVEAAMALATLTRPGPFGPRTIELGEYWGVFEAGRLVAMAGERMVALPLREVSGVCTHPDHQGHGHARRLVMHLVRRQLARGERPFLHVMHDNAGARSLYERLGFRVMDESVVRVVSRIGLRVAREDPGTADAVRLIDELSATLERLTGASGRASSDPASLRGPGACFLVARDADGTAVGCGAFRPFDDEPDAVELKRMYARPGTRGTGAALLAALEQAAREQGARVARLETRLVNARAVAFYLRHGYRRIPNYGRYAGRDEAACFEKALA